MENQVLAEDAQFVVIPLQQLRQLIATLINDAFIKHSVISNKDDPDPQFLNTKDACEFLQISRGTLQKLIVKNKIGDRKQCGKRYYLKTELLKFLNDTTHD